MIKNKKKLMTLKLKLSSKVRDLGVIFDQFLSFDDYISFVCMSTHFHLRNIGRIRHLLSLG